MKRLILFLWILSIDKKDLAEIINSLSYRQSNGRSNIRPYSRAKELVKQIPFRRHFVNDDN